MSSVACGIPFLGRLETDVGIERFMADWGKVSQR